MSPVQQHPDSQSSSSQHSSGKSTKNKLTGSEKIRAYSCVRGKVKSKTMSVKDLERNKSTYLKDRSQVKKYCGVCCKDGKTSPVSSEKEKKLCESRKGGKGAFLTDADKCKVKTVHCCYRGRISRLSEKECGKKGGTHYSSRDAAQKYCGIKKIFCCLEGSARQMYPNQCKKAGGREHDSLTDARDNCGWCCKKNGRILQLSRKECRRLGVGGYHLSKDEAEKICAGSQPRRTQTVHEPNKHGKQFQKPDSLRDLRVQAKPLEKHKPFDPGELVTKQARSVHLLAPTAGDHWEDTCGGGTVRWLYIDDGDGVNNVWDIELLNDAGSSVYSLESRCLDFVESPDADLSEGWTVKQCTERLIPSCLDVGDYNVRVSTQITSPAGFAIPVSSQSGLFRIGITDDWPMITITTPETGSSYVKLSDQLVVEFYSTSPDIRRFYISLFYNSDDEPVYYAESDPATPFRHTINLDDRFTPGDLYKVRVTNSNNTRNYTETGYFTILPPHSLSLQEHEPVNMLGSVTLEGPFEAGAGSEVHTLFWLKAYEIRWHRNTLHHAEIDFYLQRGNSRLDIGTGRADETSGTIMFYAPTNYFNRIIAVNRGTGEVIAESREFSMVAPNLEITNPAGGTYWHNGDSMEIRWQGNLLPERTLGNLHNQMTGFDGNPVTDSLGNPMQRVTLTLSIARIGSNEIPLPIVRQVPASRGFYNWQIALGGAYNFSEEGAGSSDGRPPSFGGEGRLGGVSDLLRGDYRIVLQVDQASLIFMSDIFHIDKSAFQRFRDNSENPEQRE